MPIKGRKRNLKHQLPFGWCMPTFNVGDDKAQHAACPATYTSTFGVLQGELVYCICECHHSPKEYPKSVQTVLPAGYVKSEPDLNSTEDEDTEPDEAPPEGDKPVTDTLQLDLVVEDDETWEDAAKDLAKGLSLTYTLIEAEGAGGGWPTVEFTGTPEAIEALEERYGDGEADNTPAPQATASGETVELEGSPVAVGGTTGVFVKGLQKKIDPPIKRGDPRHTMSDGIVPSVGQRVMLKDGRRGEFQSCGASAGQVLLDSGETIGVGYHNLNAN